MIWGKINLGNPITTLPMTDKEPVMIHGVREAGGPGDGEPIRLLLGVMEVKVLIGRLQDFLNGTGVPEE